MLSKFSTVLPFAVVALFPITVQQVFGQAAAPVAAETPYSSMAILPALKPIAPAIVASNEAAAAEDAKRARGRTMAYNDVRKVFAGQIRLEEGGKAKLDTWYKGYFLPNFTSPEARGDLPKMRDELLNRDLRTARAADAVAYVRTLVITYMKAYSQSPAPKYNFHPAVRYNAMLVIGGLNEIEYGARYGGSDRKALVPDPLPQALNLLISEFKSPTQIDAVRVAALVGIDRHVKLDLARPAERRIKGGTKKIIVDDMIALLNSPPPAGRTAAGHTWMQRRAIDILAAFGMVGAYPEANAALEKIVMDKDAPISLRCSASDAFAHWSPSSSAKVDASGISKNLGLIAVKACKDELDRIAALELREKEMEQLRELIKKPNPVASGQFGSGAGGAASSTMDMYGGGGGAESYGGGGDEVDQGSLSGDGGMEMYGDGMDIYGGGGLGGIDAPAPADPRIVWSQRRLKYQLTCVKRGLAGMAIAGQASPHEKAVDQVSQAVIAALALTDPPEENQTLEGLAESIRHGVSQLAFLSPEAAEGGAEPAVLVDPANPTDESALPAVDPAALPDAPAVDPAEPPAGDPALLGLPPDVE